MQQKTFDPELTLFHNFYFWKIPVISRLAQFVGLFYKNEKIHFKILTRPRTNSWQFFSELGLMDSLKFCCSEFRNLFESAISENQLLLIGTLFRLDFLIFFNNFKYFLFKILGTFIQLKFRSSIWRNSSKRRISSNSLIFNIILIKYF